MGLVAIKNKRYLANTQLGNKIGIYTSMDRKHYKDNTSPVFDRNEPVYDFSMQYGSKVAGEDEKSLNSFNGNGPYGETPYFQVEPSP